MYIGPALIHYRCYKVFLTEKRIERISDVVEFPPQNVRISIVPSADAATLAATQAAQDLVGAFKNPTPNTPFAKINYTHYIALRNLAELFSVVTKGAEQQSTNRQNGRWCEVEMEPEQGRAQITHQCPTRQQQHQEPTTRV